MDASEVLKTEIRFAVAGTADRTGLVAGDASEALIDAVYAGIIGPRPRHALRSILGMTMDPLYQQQARVTLCNWLDDPAVVTLINALGQPGLIIDDAARMVTEAAEAMQCVAETRRNHPDWQDRCILMGAMRTLAVALWRLDSDLDRARQRKILDGRQHS